MALSAMLVEGKARQNAVLISSLIDELLPEALVLFGNSQNAHVKTLKSMQSEIQST